MEDDGDTSGSDWEEEPDENGLSNPTICLFCPALFPSPELVFEHCSSEHSFDIAMASRKYSLDAISYIKMINFIRKHSIKTDVCNILKQNLWRSDEYMKPSLKDDPLLMFDIEDYIISQENSPTNIPEKIVTLTKQQYDRLTDKLQTTQRQLQEALEDMNKMRQSAQHILMGPPPMPALPGHPSAQPVCHANHIASMCTCNRTEEEEDPYFSCYAHYGIHHEMLMDTVRTEAYRDTILKNGDIFRDKVVLDVGCGTGILSMFAASSGAKQVLAVDQSDVIYQAMDIVRFHLWGFDIEDIELLLYMYKENNLHGVITLLKGRVEDICLPVEKVDIIISEWMGYFMLFEGMLDTVLLARDKFLKEGGLLLPDRCTMSLVAISDHEMHQKYLGFWDDVYGYRMSCIKNEVVREANIESVDQKHICSYPVQIKEFDLLHCTVESRDFKCRFVIQFTKECIVTALVGYFDCFFEKGLMHQVHLSTSLNTKPTHWKQTVFLLPRSIQVSKDQKLDGTIVCQTCRKDMRSLVVTLSLGTVTQVYSLN